MSLAPLSAALGIDIGSVNVKVCLLDGEGRPRHAVVAHEGDLGAALDEAFSRVDLIRNEAPLAMATGGTGRQRLAIPDLIAPLAIETALSAKGLRPRAVVSMGGEDLVVYVLDPAGRIQTCYAGNKCASGTGEFFRQQLGRMDLAIEDLDRAAEGAKVIKLSARCSVFMKSDCTHRLNKGEATRGDIALSLSKVMADKVGEFLIKAKIREGQVVLIGGVTQNRHLIRSLRDAWPKVEFVVPLDACWFEAHGAAIAARQRGRALPVADLLRPRAQSEHGLYRPLATARDRVIYHPARRGTVRADRAYILGIDGGSTTTKAALIDRETLELAAAHYGRTHGDPVGALKECLRHIKEQCGDVRPRITIAATTGSSRELLGVFVGSDGVYNEIIAHATGTAHFAPEVDTIFEIGGQDAKYVLLNNGVPIDYAMNEACSAGTGSFLEESAAGDLDIGRAEDIGPIALEAQAPLKFGEHCSAFINSDIRKAIQEGSARPDIVAGLVFSIVSNYLNRVVGNRTIGDRIALQGGVAKNPAVPLAFAQLLGKHITVPPDPELMGSFGVARLARRKSEEGLLPEGAFDLDALIEKNIVNHGEFVCRACDNYCTIRNLEAGGKRYPFGGRCSKYTGARRRTAFDESSVADHVAWRTQQHFSAWVPAPATLVPRSPAVVGVPVAFSVHSLWPFYARFFHELGVRTMLSEKVVPEGVYRQESNYCFPAEIAHGAIQDLIDRGAGYLFLPHFRDMPTMEEKTAQSCVCPLTQGLPYYAKQAFGLDDAKILRPVVSFKDGWDACRPEFEDVAEKLGAGRSAGRKAFDAALAHYRDFMAAYKERGRELIDEMRANPDRLYVALLGRPYNAFTRDANMGIPRKFLSRGVTVVPFDLIFNDGAEIFPNMYWFYGQQDMKAVGAVRDIPNLYLAWISNFSCAPDSFMLHYVRWMMGRKPYLVLEIDSHTADAGLDTRIEAFLDIVESYRRHALSATAAAPARRYRLENRSGEIVIHDGRTAEQLDIRHPRVTLVWPSLGDLATEITAAASRKQGVYAEHLPVADINSTQVARNVASGKECIPALLVLGTVLQFLEKRRPRRPDEVLLVYVPSTTGPCRTGQYHVFYERLFEELGFENVLILAANSDNSYREIGISFSRDMWRGVVLSDHFTDARTGIRLLAQDPAAGLRIFDKVWREVVDAMARDDRALDAAIERAARELAAIPKRRTLDDIRRVLIVGEIYVRRDDFSVKELFDLLIASDIFPKATGITEWVHYTDWSQRYLLGQEVRRGGPLTVLRPDWLRRRVVLGVEGWWMHRVEEKIKRALFSTGLVPPAPDDVGAAIAFGGKEFVSPELESEATVSPAVAAVGMQDGYAGIAIIAPFGCLPGRLIEGVFSPWAKSRGYPVIALENDGQPYPPNTIARLEVFSANVNRFSRDRDPAVSRSS